MSRTKMKLSFAFIDLLESKQIKDVTIGDICKQSNYSRETFYYHFKNKYDLIAWTHYFQKESYFKAYFGLESFTETVARILKDMKKVEIFYLRGFEDPVDTNLEEIMMTHTIDIYTKMVKHILKKNTLSDELEMSVYYSVYGAVRIMKEWLLTDNDVDEDQLAVFIYNSLNENLRDIFSDSYNPPKRETVGA